jgi:hypothetical protein
MSTNKRLFLILWSVGMAGVLSFLLIDISKVISALPLPPDQTVKDLPPPWLLKILTVAQPTVLMSLAVLAGVGLAERVGLHSPVAQAAARGENLWAALKPLILPGVVTGVVAGIAVMAIWVVFQPFLTPEFVTRAREFNTIIPVPMRFLYGGFTEELLLRWGVMTALVWLQWRLLQRGEGQPKVVFFILAILVSAVVFGLGHLPVAAALSGGLTVPLVAYVILANSIFGIVAGFLYWLRGLEAAMISHIFVHVVLLAAIWMSF